MKTWEGKESVVYKYSTPVSQNSRKLNRYPLTKEGDRKEARKVKWSKTVG